MLKKILFLLIIAPFFVACTAEALPASGVASVMTEQNAQGFLISLDARGVPLERLLGELSRQCRLSIANRGAACLHHSVSIRLSGVPLEQAIKKLFKAAGVYNYLIQYSGQGACPSLISGITILCGSERQEAGEALTSPVGNPDEQPFTANDQRPVSEQDPFSEKLTSFKARYSWTSDELLKRTVYLLEAMPDEVKASGLDSIMRELDRSCGPGSGTEIGEEILYRAIEAAAPPGMAPVMMKQVRRLSERYKSDLPVDGPEEPSGDATPVFRNEGRQ